MPNEGRQKVLAAAEALELILYGVPELTNVGSGIVRQTGELRVIPDAFVRVQLGSIRGQAVGPKFRVEGEEVSNQPRVVVDVDPVPDDVHRTPELSTQEAEELHDVLGSDVPVLLQQVEVQAQSVAPGTDRDRAYGGEPVMAIPAFLDWRVAPRRERPPHQGSEHEAGFIEEN